MTATRWWVQLFARWQARVDSVQGQIQSASLVITAYSTFSLLLQNSGYGALVRPLGVVIALVGPLYAYAYFEGGVWNQVNKDRADMSNNYAEPSSRINNEMTARALYAAQKGEQLSEAEREAVQEELDIVFAELRDGIELDQE